MLKGSDPQKIAEATAAAAATEKKRRATESQAAIEELMKFERSYDALVVQAKNSAALYADLIKARTPSSRSFTSRAFWMRRS